MARYFFDLHDADGSMPDYEGTECAGAHVVSALAARILSEIASSDAQPDEQRNLFMSVRDESGRIAHVATLTLTNTWLAAPVRADPADCAADAA
jgi:hypothetical protein